MGYVERMLKVAQNGRGKGKEGMKWGPHCIEMMSGRQRKDKAVFIN